MTELTSSVRNLKKQTEPRLKLLSGNLGITLAGIDVVDVPNRAGWVYVRLLNNTSELIQAYNGIVSPIYNLPVLVKRNKDRYEITGRDTLRYQNWGTTSYLPKHGLTHSFDRNNGGGSDMVWVHQEQFYPLAPSPSGTSGAEGLLVAPYIYNWFGEWKYAGGVVTPDVTSYQPTGSSSSKIMLLCLEGNSETFHFIEGNEAPYNSTGLVDLLSYLPFYDPGVDIPIAAIRISSGTTSIGWDEIYDVRQFYNREILTGTAGVSGVDNFLDLTDTPNSYAGQNGKYVRVNAGENALEFSTGTGGSGGGIEEAPIDGNQYGRENGAWTEISITGTSSSGGLYWNPALPPSTPNSLDDEFNDSSFNTGTWTVMDTYTNGTITEDEVGLKMDTAGYNIMISITQPVPAADYTVWTKVSLDGGIYDGWGNCGICFQEDMASDDIYTVGPQIAGANDHGDVPVTTGYWTSAEAYSGPGTWGKYYPMSLWIRVRVDVSEKIYYTDLSLDGLSWQCCGSDTLVYTPTRMGLFFTQADGTDKAIYSFFRVTDSIDSQQIMQGNR